MSKMVFNTRERAVSSDHNRLQAMLSAEVAEVLRHWLIAKTDEASAAGVEVVEGTITTPLTAVVLAGLRAVPQLGGTSLTVVGGTLVAIETTNDTGDDSPLKIVNDDGESAGLLFLANPGPGTRIDIVECQILYVAAETDSRDIYDPMTGGFSPTSVTKVIAPRLDYRIRRGTPGAGVPANEAGWLPLMVACVSTTAATWDDCPCYDVRPLASDLQAAPANINDDNPRHDSRFAITRVGGAGTVSYVEGKLGASFKRKRAGGAAASATFPIAIESAGADGADAEPNAVTGFASTWGLGFLYAAFPAGLPRWCRYTPAASGSRVPGSFRGVPVFSRTRPSNAKGLPSAVLTMPTASGLGGVTTSEAIALTAAFMSDQFTTRKVRSMVCDGEWTSGPQFYSLTLTPVAVNAPIVATSVNTTTAVFDLVDATDNYPPNAKALRVVATIVFNADGINADSLINANVTVDNPNETTASTTADCKLAVMRAHYRSVSGSGGALSIEAEIPMVPTSGATTRTLTFDYVIGAHTGLIAKLAVTGFKF